MKGPNKIKWWFSLALLLPILVGCQSTLAPGGAYAPTVSVTNTAGAVTTTTVLAPDIGFYIADSAFVSAESILDIAFRFEKDNREALWKLSPEIKHTLDSIRPGAQQACISYKSARDAYKKNPTPAGLDLLNTILSKVQSLSSAASAAVTSAQKTSTAK